MPPINVVCVDDSPDITELFSACINSESDMSCVGCFSDAQSMLDAIGAGGRLSEPNVILLDLSMPGLSAIDGIRELSRIRPDIRVIVVTGRDDGHALDRAVEAGAWGFISKHGDVGRVIEAVRRVASGQMVLNE